MSYLTNFTVESGRAILMEIIKTVNQPENSKTISLAKASAGKEMIAMMQLVFPLVMKIQMEVITNFGFPGNITNSCCNKFNQNDDGESRKTSVFFSLLLLWLRER